MSCVAIKIYGGCYKYDNLKINEMSMIKVEENKGNLCTTQSKIDGVLLHYLIRNLLSCNNCRKNFYDCYSRNNISTIKFYMETTQFDLMDYNWNFKLSILIRLKCELDHVLSWLSTLGGAFSALGDYFVNMAHTAGKISIWQLHLAYCLGDPNIMSRCKLYYSLSLIQRKQFKYAQQLIKSEYDLATNNAIRDDRLINMCRGIWAKLQYEKNVFIKNKYEVK